ncbi:hypothetical protein J2X68_002764 [Streptomyces sp. 3330]|uniref:hypothetical protein n=1 Tax=Streptomyces sp. 3330 TaxID=2817755 RepID=UPI002861EE0A|nr:hypothetical protein [Streptomyces sp. 3330]MDR6976076.1 hypothetical protein [Streptomyces sp. 3330]
MESVNAEPAASIPAQVLRPHSLDNCGSFTNWYTDTLGTEQISAHRKNRGNWRSFVHKKTFGRELLSLRRAGCRLPAAGCRLPDSIRMFHRCVTAPVPKEFRTGIGRVY